jgi:hypothetical protein
MAHGQCLVRVISLAHSGTGRASMDNRGGSFRPTGRMAFIGISAGGLRAHSMRMTMKYWNFSSSRPMRIEHVANWTTDLACPDLTSDADPSLSGASNSIPEVQQRRIAARRRRIHRQGARIGSINRLLGACLLCGREARGRSVGCAAESFDREPGLSPAGR